jgi:hypothetical protein
VLSICHFLWIYCHKCSKMWWWNAWILFWSSKFIMNNFFLYENSITALPAFCTCDAFLCWEIQWVSFHLFMGCTGSLKSSCCHVQNIEFLQQYLLQSLKNGMCLLLSLVDIVWLLAVFMIIAFFKINLTVSSFPHFFCLQSCDLRVTVTFQ